MAVYQITCSACQKEIITATYIGQSRSPIRIRFNEHLGDARLRKPDTGLGDHTFEYHSDTDSQLVNSNFRIKILTTKNHEAELRICESMYVHQRQPP